MLERLAEKYFQLNLGGQIFTSFTEFALYKTKSNTEVKFWTNMLETTWSCDSFDTVFIKLECIHLICTKKTPFFSKSNTINKISHKIFSQQHLFTHASDD